jgi:DNA-binding response OmpR family regulator
MSQKKKILLVEDDAVLRETLVEFLKKEDFDAVSAPDGGQGLKVAQEENPDLILLDIILPRKNGYEVLGELKKNDKTKDIPVVILTNLASLDDIEKALNLGATNYLVKGDYKLQEIVEKIRSIMG